MPTRRQASIVIAEILLLSLQAKAQNMRKHGRIGILMPYEEADPETGKRLNVVANKLEELGWKTGSDLEFLVKYANGDPAKLTDLAKELVSNNVDIILTAGTEGSKAAYDVTKVLPIVMATIGDPVGAGLAQSLAHPGGNITGLSLNASNLNAKRVEYARLCIPAIKRIAIVGNMGNESVSLKAKHIEAASAAYHLEARIFDIPTPSKIQNALESIKKWNSDVIFTTEDAIIVSNRTKIISLSENIGVPVMSEFALLADAGAVLSYGPVVIDLWKRSATYIDKILRGTSPSDLPIEQPVSFELVLNRRSADKFGLQFPVNLEGAAARIVE